MNVHVDRLIRAMTSICRQTGLTWDQGIDQQPQDVQAVLARAGSNPKIVRRQG